MMFTLASPNVESQTFRSLKRNGVSLHAWLPYNMQFPSMVKVKGKEVKLSVYLTN
jgi:hypothetical protein